MSTIAAAAAAAAADAAAAASEWMDRSSAPLLPKACAFSPIFPDPCALKKPNHPLQPSIIILLKRTFYLPKPIQPRHPIARLSSSDLIRYLIGLLKSATLFI
jgi:hypothetical protein